VLRVPENRFYSSILPLVDSSIKERDTESVFFSECKILCRPNLESFFNLVFKEVLHLPMIWNH
jgi:hypothetical protein